MESEPEHSTSGSASTTIATSAEAAPEISDVIDLTELSDSPDEEDDDAELRGDEEETRSSSSGVEITLDETSRARLHEVISNVDERRLRHVMHMLANTIPAAEEVLMRELITLKRKSCDDRELMVVARWETCAQCDEEFDVSRKREDKECCFHPGEIEANEELFCDWDEDCHGPMDTPENRSDYPENFSWTCCGNDGSSDGCAQGIHRAAVTRKKQRV